MPTVPSANMMLPIPVIGQDPGPDYAANLNASLTILDAHNHAPGSGVLISPDGLDINTDLTFGSNNATALRSVRFTAQGAPLALVTDLGCIYESGVDLYYNDGVGNQVRITQSGGIAGTPGSITGLVPPASVNYSSGPGTFIFQSGVNISANLDGASITLRNQTLASNGITISAPAALASNFTITLPGSLPSTGTQALFINSAGTVSFQPSSGGAAVVGPGGTFTTIAAAITATAAGGYITVTTGVYTENISINKNLTIVGQGYGTVLNGTLTFAAGSDECLWRQFKHLDNVTINSGVTEITYVDFWLAAGKTITNNGTGCFIQGMQL